MLVRRTLRVILAVSVLGILFSGVLTYLELFGKTAVSCPTPGAPGTILGYPACVYGLVMYLLIAALASRGLGRLRRHTTG